MMVFFTDNAQNHIYHIGKQIFVQSSHRCRKSVLGKARITKLLDTDNTIIFLGNESDTIIIVNIVHEDIKPPDRLLTRMYDC